MLKLYRKSDSDLRYWEAWWDGQAVTFHWGIVGKRGSVHQLNASEQEGKQLIADAALKAKKRGFHAIPISKHHQLVIQYQLATWGSAEDLDKREAVEHLVNQSLGWTGNGRCDGGDIGSGTMNIFCEVVDWRLAAKQLLLDLESEGLLQGVRIGLRTRDSYKVIHPPEDRRPFNPL